MVMDQLLCGGSIPSLGFSPLVEKTIGEAGLIRDPVSQRGRSSYRPWTNNGWISNETILTNCLSSLRLSIMQRFISFQRIQRIGCGLMTGTLVATALGAMPKQAYGAQLADASLGAPGTTTIYEPVISPTPELGELKVGPTPTNPVVIPAEVGYTPSDQNDPRVPPISMLMSNQDVIDACTSTGRAYDSDTKMCGGSNVRRS